MFGIGKKKKLLEWQNKLLDVPSKKLVMNARQLELQTQARVEQDLRIINDCKKLISTTTKPDVFFARLNMLEVKARDMCEFERYIKFKGTKPSAAYKEVQHDKQEAIFRFLQRYYIATIEKAEKNKTDKAKLKRWEEFHDSMEVYYNVMNADNIDYVETKYNACTRYYKK